MTARIRRVGIILFLGSVLISIAYYARLKHDLEPAPGSPQHSNTNWSQIEDGLYMGGLISEPPPGTQAVLCLCEQADVYRTPIYQHDPIPDSAPAPKLEWLRKQVKFVEDQRRAGTTTYVHCAAGVSRAGMVMTAYQMAKNNWTRDEALAFIRSKRPVVRPNDAFMELLLEWENTLAIKPPPAKS